MTRVLLFLLICLANMLPAQMLLPLHQCSCIECIPPSACEEKKLLDDLCCDSRRLYHSLDCEGKRRALTLAEEYEDKECAVEEAAREMFIRMQNEYPNQKTYQRQIQEQSGQNLYNERFGY